MASRRIRTLSVVSMLACSWQWLTQCTMIPAMMLQCANAGQRLAVVFVMYQMELQASISFILKVLQMLLFYGERKKEAFSLFGQNH